MKKENKPGEAAAERPRLSKRTVTENALKLADADGLDALTIRKLAQHLGVTPMALYWHFRSKEDLLEGVAEQLWGEIDVNTDPDAPWWAQLQGLLESLVTVLRAHPAAAQLLLEHEKRNEAALRAMEVTLDVLRRAGFDAEHASAIARSTLWTGITLVMSEPGYHPDLPPEDREETQRRSQVQLAMLPASRYPRLIECAVPMTNCDEPDFHYRFGIDLFIRGVTPSPVMLTVDSLGHVHAGGAPVAYGLHAGRGCSVTATQFVLANGGYGFANAHEGMLALRDGVVTGQLDAAGASEGSGVLSDNVRYVDNARDTSVINTGLPEATSLEPPTPVCPVDGCF